MFDAGVRRCLLVVAAAALVAVGCGSAENEPSIAAAVEKTESAGSSRIEMSGTESQSGSAIECRGEADYASERIALDGINAAFDRLAAGASIRQVIEID